MIQSNRVLHRNGRLTTLATFPKSGTTMIQHYLFKLTGACPQSIYFKECKGNKLHNQKSGCVQVFSGKKVYAQKSCVKSFGEKHYALVKNHLNMEKHCFGVRYERNTKRFKNIISNSTADHDRIVHVIRNP